MGDAAGTTPLHITAMRKAIDSVPERPANGQEPLSVVERDDQALEAHQPTQFAQKLADGQFVFAVEMDPPLGLSTHNRWQSASLLCRGWCGRD